MTSESPYAAKPWLALYDEGVPTEPELRYRSGLEQLQRSVERFADRPALIYIDTAITYRELDEAVAAFATALAEEFGVGPGDRVMLQLQNMPAFFIAQYAVWTLGGIVVPINPMFREAEVVKLASDARPKVLVQVDDLYAERHAGIEALGIAIVTVSPSDYVEQWPQDRLGSVERLHTTAAADMGKLIERYRGSRPEPAPLGPDDTAYFVYTSGTTGPPKGAMNSHRAVLFNSENYRIWCHLSADDVCLAMAPLFHVTGLIGHVGVGIQVGMPILLGYRFDPVVQLRMIERYRATWIIGAITAYIALLNEPSIERYDLSSLSKAWSGGQAVSPATVDALQDKLGVYVHNIYGLTETTSQSHAVPADRKAPVDPISGALAVGLPCPGYECRVIGEDGAETAPGETGEILTRAPAVVAGYWNRPEESAAAIRDGWLYTGDVGFMDAAGWFFIVDRIKDMIVASGFKIWPREVEDVLYQHPAVLEAAVIGIPDEYRGETVAAFVSLRPGQQATEGEISDFCKQRLAAYKYPRRVTIVTEVPKNASGKILRRELRAT